MLYEFNKQKLYTLQRIKDEITNIEHRFTYVLFQIERNLANRQYDQIKKTIASYQQKLLYRKKFIDTNNPVFDYFLTLCLNNFSNKTEINTNINISKNDIYNNLNLVNNLSNLIFCFHNYNFFQLQITEINNHVVIKIYYPNKFNDISHIISQLDYLKSTYDAIYNFKPSDINELKIVFEMDKLH